jgi:uncharacterized membrane protein
MIKQSFDAIKTNIHSRIVFGVIISIPLCLTFFILRFFFIFLYGLVEKFLLLINPFFTHVSVFVVLFLSLCAMVMVLYLTGLCANLYIGKQIILFWENIFLKIPFIKTVYSTLKKIVAGLSSTQPEFSSVVFVNFPSSELRSLAFGTGPVHTLKGEKYQKVFIPTPLNPFSGILQFVPDEYVQKTDISMEDALQFVVSDGIISPEKMNVH